MDQAHARQRLEEMRRELEENSGAARAEGAEFREEAEYESGSLSQHPGDYATDVTNRMEQNLLLEDSELERERVLAALRRLDDGSYGSCMDCGRPIGDDRLEARPQADRCLACEEKAERRGTR